MWETLVRRLETCGIPFAFMAWDSKPSGDYGTYSQDFGNELYGDGTVVETSLSCSVDLFLRKPDQRKVDQIQQLLSDVVGTWDLTSIQYEADTRLIHYEWTFDVEG